MAKYTIIKLSHLTPLHIGTGKENYDFSASELQSDTISAALASIRAQLGNDSDLIDFMRSFTISSAFPMITINGKTSYFFPKMQGKLNIAIKNSETDEYRKQLKNVKYIDISVFEKLITGGLIEIESSQLCNDFITSKETQFETIYESRINERVGVPRAEDQDAEPFFFDWKYFNTKGGLYCLIDTTEEALPEIISLFESLGEIGLGTDKNIGGGKFDVDVDTITLSIPEKTNAAMLLSLFIPTEDDMNSINLNTAKYSVLLRGGYISGSQEESFRHLRKKSIYMFGVGSTFLTSNTLKGKIVDLRPEWNDEKIHPVYRNGIPFYIPIKQ